MKLLSVAILAVVAVGVTAVLQGKGAMTRTPQTREAAYAEMQRFAEQRLQLTRIDCGDIMSVRPDTPCYVTDLPPEAVRTALNGRSELEMLTGWRDDYGVLGAGFGWQGGPWRMGVVYARTDAEDFDDRPEIQRHAGMVKITIDTR